MTDAVRQYRDACRAPACSIDREAFNWNRATALLRGRDYLAKYADAAIAALQASERRGCTCYSRDEDCPLHGAWDAKNMRLRSKP